MKGYPQYVGYFDDWKVGRVTRTINDKWGDMMAEPGEYVLVKPVATMPFTAVPRGTTIYLDSDHHWMGRQLGNEKGCVTEVAVGHVEIIS